VEVLRGVDVTVGAGEFLAVLGENGAGKTTLLRCVAGLVSPTAGTVRVAGRDAAAGGVELRRDVAYVTGDGRSFSWRISGRANLAFFASLYGWRGAAAAARIDDVLGRVGLAAEARDRPVAEYSTGMRQRLALARGFLAEPKVWLLDEPTAGLDPRGARAALADIRAHCAGAAVIVATHVVEHARQVAARAVALRAGRVVHDGDLDGAVAALEAGER
jgi:ABC-2 type transport system ATP-binding protein